MATTHLLLRRIKLFQLIEHVNAAKSFALYRLMYRSDRS